MEYKKNIYWLASYPKSGNTWFRIFLSSYLNNAEFSDLNEIKTGTIASSRVLFDDIFPLPSSELSTSEIRKYRAKIYKEFSLNLKEISYNKVHDAYIYIENEPMFPSEISAGVIYFVRNPLDVVVSYANHSSIDIDKSVAAINNDDMRLSKTKNKLTNQLEQYLGSWNFHVKSWTEQKNIPVLVLRYEDMLDNPVKEFSKAIEFLNLDFDKKILQKAIENSSFEKLRKFEETKGFKEKPIQTKNFFYKGKSGNWKEFLNKNQINIVIEKNREQMLKFGYFK